MHHRGLSYLVKYEEDEDEEGDDDDPITKKEGFGGARCWRCGEEIHMYHRYYYTCSSSCDDFSLHKFCVEIMSRYGKLEELFDKYYQNHLSIEVGKNIIYHPCHPHLLMCLIPKPILCECSACGKEHKGIFYQCTFCVGFTMHSECAFLPEKLFIQERTDGAFHHTHPLTISYSFPFIDQQTKHYPRCRVCGRDFLGYKESGLWIYKCDKCMYYAHLDCATSRTEPFMSIFLSPGAGRTNKNYKDVDHPGLLHLPFPDETYSLPKHYLFFQQSSTDQHHHHHKVDEYLKHMSHQHPLALIDVDQTQSKSNTQTSSSLLLLKCHDPMKKTQLLCNGCIKPIMSTMPFYKCPHQSCNDFALHEWCTRLPQEIENHPTHPQHNLYLICSNILGFFFDVFNCAIYNLPCNGFAYCCFKCGYYVDVTCGFIPKEITHKAHPNHLLSILQLKGDKYDTQCHMCLMGFYRDELSFHCSMCDIYIHPECALLLAETIRHKYDKHPMKLSYLPIENHKSEYFCEICEEHLNPHQSFYHCKDCAQSVHTACASSILQCETETYSLSCWRNSIHFFLNIKFGGIHKNHSHPHSLSFAQGTVLDGQCSICGHRLQYEMIFKCRECKFAIHFNCCKHLRQI
ncbi:hypothetical protein Lser_V15G38590 [Lactuca serriola]